MILLDHVVQILARSHPYAARQRSGLFSFSDRPMQGGVAVQGDYSASSIITHCPGKESLGSRDVPSFAQKKVNGAVRFIHGAVEVDPAAFDFEVSLVHAPGTAHRPRVMVPAFFKVRHATLYPPQDSRVSH